VIIRKAILPLLASPALVAAALACAAGCESAVADTSAASQAAITARSGSTQATGRPTEAQISAALDELRRDPDLASAHQMRVLRWSRTSTQPPAEVPGWVQWIAGLFASLAALARLLIWCACAVVVGLIGVFLTRTLRGRSLARSPAPVAPPTHVSDLDIRPASLPGDVGAAARMLWERGEHRDALALLYRACLSRLTHVHGAPVRSSTTEHECIELAKPYLSEAASQYVATLVRSWQWTVYRGQAPSTQDAIALCNGFRQALDPQSRAGAADPPAGGAGQPA